jgi:hypothetical protein
MTSRGFAAEGEEPMGRKGAASPSGSSRKTSHLHFLASLRWPFGIKGSVFVAAVLALLGIVAFAATREMSATSRATSPVLSRPAAPARPAFTPAEEAYVRALWPIHGDVERSAVRLALGQIFYKINDMDRIALKARADQALATYRQSETRLRALEPPPSVQREHEAYLAAVALFQQSTVEILKMFADGRDDHLLAAYPLGQEATDKIREVGGKFWPNEFPPN